MTIKLIDAAKYYQELSWQNEAWNYLQDNTSPEILDQFAKMYRNEKQQSSTEQYTIESINWNDMTSKVSKYFTVGEVTQNDIRRIPKDNTIKANILDLAEELDIVREAWGAAIAVTSWYRPPDVNKEVGGAKNSQHLYGLAADIYPTRGDVYSFQNWLDKGLWKDKALGYGANKGFVHLDLRQGHIRWNY